MIIIIITIIQKKNISKLNLADDERGPKHHFEVLTEAVSVVSDDTSDSMSLSEKTDNYAHLLFITESEDSLASMPITTRLWL